MALDVAPSHLPIIRQQSSKPVVVPGEFVFAAACLNHPHIFGQCAGLIEAGATLKWVYDPDPHRIAAFIAKFPQAKAASALAEILDDRSIQLVAAAAIPNERAALGCLVMSAGKDYFTDKTPFTSIDQLAEARRVTLATGRKYMVYYSERLHSECAMLAVELVRAGKIGRVTHVLGLGPHRLNSPSRPSWFFERARYGGILCDIGSHQFEQFLTYSGATDAEVTDSSVGNYANPTTPEFEDFGQATLVGNNGVSNYVRVDWLTPDGLRTWGDGRTLITGTMGYIELRKYVDIASPRAGEQLYLVDARGEHRIEAKGRIGFRFFGDLILDCLERTERSMSQAHTFKAAELCLQAQAKARNLTPDFLR